MGFALPAGGVARWRDSGEQTEDEKRAPTVLFKTTD